ncbi:MAG: response regulator [Lachnospiraceae bacterium]|nr:response regulator [Lachnospiraceae bacterium]
MREEICFITSRDHGFLISKLRNLFEAAEIEVCVCSDDVAEIKKNRQEIDIFIYYSDAGYARADSTMAYLSGLCFDEHKSLCLIGEESFLSKALASDSYGSVRYWYTHPVDSNQVVQDIKDLFLVHAELDRRKQLMIVDGDDDFLAIMNNWLGPSYDIVGVNTGKDALEHIKENRCDLILLDYEMPDLNGYQIMDRVRKNPLTSDIPLIFLTGINDREGVMNIIRHRPDGYLLKTTRKTELLDILDRFFAESILRRNRHGIQ